MNRIYTSNSGIYCIRNLKNGRVYIGQAKRLNKRCDDHRLSYNSLGSEYNKQLYQAFRKHGIENFVFEILEEFENYDQKQLNLLEEKYIKEYNSYHNGYNASLFASGGFYNQEHEEKCTKILEKQNAKQKGCNHPRAFFNEKQIREIFNYAMLGAPASEIYELYKDTGITRYSFYSVYNGKKYKQYLPEGWEQRPKVHTNAIIWGCVVIEIKKAIKEGIQLPELYKRFSEYPSLVLKDIYNGRTYKHIVC